MGYTIFERKRIQSGTPGVSFSTGGRVGINQAATQILQANAVENVLLLWDEERRRVAIRPITKKDKRAYRLTQGKSSSMFSGKSFLEYIGYDMGETRSFPAEWNEEDEIFEVEIPAEYFKSKRQRRLASAS
jgi:hypothetical protein